MSMYRDAMRQAKKQSRPSGVVQRRKPSVSHDTQIQIRRAKVKQAVNRKYAEAVEEDAKGYSTPRTAAEHAAQKSGCPPSWKAKVTSNILFYQKGCTVVVVWPLPCTHVPRKRRVAYRLRMTRGVRPCRSPYAGSFYLIAVLFPRPLKGNCELGAEQIKDHARSCRRDRVHAVLPPCGQ